MKTEKYSHDYMHISSMISFDNTSGTNNVSAEKWILLLIERYPGIQPSDMEVKLNKIKNGSTPIVSRRKLYNVLQRLTEERVIDRETQPGKKAVKYFIHGYRSTLPFRIEPSQFDDAVVEECRDVISQILRSKCLLSNPRRDGFPVDVVDSDGKDPVKRELLIRFASLYDCIESWEKARGVLVNRPWSNDLIEPFLIYGPDFFEAMSEGKTERSEFEDFRYPSLKEWLQFFISALDAISYNRGLKRGKSVH